VNDFVEMRGSLNRQLEHTTNRLVELVRERSASVRVRFPGPLLGKREWQAIRRDQGHDFKFRQDRARVGSSGLFRALISEGLKLAGPSV